jgi:hypothetical protein
VISTSLAWTSSPALLSSDLLTEDRASRMNEFWDLLGER